MRAERVLVAGATGALGKHVVSELVRRGYRTRALVRDPATRGRLSEEAEVFVVDLLAEEQPLDDALAGVDVVFSAAGQRAGLERRAERASFMATDYPMNKRLLDAAINAGARKFVYVTVLGGEKLRHLDYVRAHEQFVDALVASTINHTIVRANGFFSSYLDLLEAARRGPVVMFGNGQARSNPIHEAELAAACVDAIETDDRLLEVGGPEVLTRRQEVEQAFAALGKKPRTIRLPTPILGATLLALRRIDRRRAEMVAFVSTITRIDVLAPTRGERRLSDYLCEHAERQ
jgi:uncharacterized protein YbjT (DUF2867 family)